MNSVEDPGVRRLPAGRGGAGLRGVREAAVRRHRGLWREPRRAGRDHPGRHDHGRVSAPQALVPAAPALHADTLLADYSLPPTATRTHKSLVTVQTPSFLCSAFPNTRTFPLAPNHENRGNTWNYVVSLKQGEPQATNTRF